MYGYTQQQPPNQWLMVNSYQDVQRALLPMDGSQMMFMMKNEPIFYIASIVNVTHERVSKIISSLKDKGYVSVKLKYKKDSKEIEERQITPIVENINRYSQDVQEGTQTNNYSDSQKQPYPMVEKDKDIINNIKNKNNYNNGTQNFKKTKANFEERAYEGFNFDTLYANYSMMKGTS